MSKVFFYFSIRLRPYIFIVHLWVEYIDFLSALGLIKNGPLFSSRVHHRSISRRALQLQHISRAHYKSLLMMNNCWEPAAHYHSRTIQQQRTKMGLGRRRCHRRDVDQPAEQYRISPAAAQRISSSSSLLLLLLLLSTTTISILKFTHTKGNSSSTWLFNVTSHPLALSLLVTDFSLLAKSINHVVVVVRLCDHCHIGAISLL